MLGLLMKNMHGAKMNFRYCSEMLVFFHWYGDFCDVSCFKHLVIGHQMAYSLTVWPDIFALMLELDNIKYKKRNVNNVLNFHLHELSYVFVLEGLWKIIAKITDYKRLWHLIGSTVNFVLLKNSFICCNLTSLLLFSFSFYLLVFMLTWHGFIDLYSPSQRMASIALEALGQHW